MIPVSIQIRQALERVWLPVMLLLSVAMILLGWANQRLTNAARMAVADVLSPVWAVIAEPGEQLSAALLELRGIGHLAQENARLRMENETLRGWYDVAVSLTEENQTLKTNLHWMPDPVPSFVTGRVVGDAGGLYSHAVLIGAGPQSGVRVGNVALAADGFVGRVTETGGHSARILLIDDVASRIPVTLETSHGTAIMAGDNSTMPRLMYYAQDNHPIEGERVVTSGQAELLPAGLPVGTVHYIRASTPVVAPYARLDHLTILRVFDFDSGTIDSPDAPGRVPVAPLRQRGAATGRDNPMDGMTLGGVVDGLSGRAAAGAARSSAAGPVDGPDSENGVTTEGPAAADGQANGWESGTGTEPETGSATGAATGSGDGDDGRQRQNGAGASGPAGDGSAAPAVNQARPGRG